MGYGSLNEYGGQQHASSYATGSDYMQANTNPNDQTRQQLGSATNPSIRQGQLIIVTKIP